MTFLSFYVVIVQNSTWSGKFCLLSTVTRRLDYFFDTWPFTTKKISPIEQEICQSRFKFAKYKIDSLPIAKVLQNLPKVSKFSQIWSQCFRENFHYNSLGGHLGGHDADQTVFLKKLANLGLFIVYCWSLQTKIFTIFQHICEKMSIQ